MAFHEYPYTDFHEMNLDWVIAKVKELTLAWAQTSSDWEELRTFVNDYFANLNVQNEINNKLDELASDGTLSALMAPYVASGLPAVVADQIAAVVADQIAAVVAAQLPAEVAEQIPGAVAGEAANWLSEHVDPSTGYVIDDTLTIAGAAADAKAAGDAISELKSALSNNADTLYELANPFYNKVSDITVGIVSLNKGLEADGMPYNNNKRAFINPTNIQGKSLVIIEVTGDYTLLNVHSYTSTQADSHVRRIPIATNGKCYIIPLSSENYIRFTVKRDDDDDMSADDADAILEAVHVYEAQNVVERIEANESNIKNLSFADISQNDGRKCFNDWLINTTINSAGQIVYYNGRISTLKYYRASSDLPIINDNETKNLLVLLYNDDLSVISRTLYNTSFVIIPKDTIFRLCAYTDGEELTSIYPIASNVKIQEMTSVVDVLIFCGQSNMAGRGITNASHPETYPTVPIGYAWEYKAITSPNNLYPLTEPFGVAENNNAGINDGNMKTGDLVAAFSIAYYNGNGNVPMVGVSASKGGSGIDDWQPSAETNYLTDALSRLSSCVTYLTNRGYKIRHKYLVWCQGEHDWESVESYTTKWQTMYNQFKSAGIEKCLMIRIGNTNTGDGHFTNMIAKQTEMAQTNSDIVMVSTDFAGMSERGMMKDDLHFFQDAYNECGRYAGVNAGIFASTGKEVTMYDPEYENLYFCHKN